MDKEFSTRLAEALTSRLCHELVNPIGAAGNGIEILREDPAFAEDAAAMVGLSLRQAARRLQFYRFAYGSTNEPGEDGARAATIEFYEESKLACYWPSFSAPLALGWSKLIMNLTLLASECLPRGGIITVGQPPADHSSLRIQAEGQSVRIPETMAELLSPDLPAEKIVPRSVHAVFTAALAARLGFGIEIGEALPGHLMLSLLRV